MKTLELFEFELGGYFAENSVIAYENGSAEYCSYTHGPEDKKWLHKTIAPKEVQQLIDGLEKLNVTKWDKEYVNHGMMDGTQWTLVIKYNGTKKKKVYGSNSYPNPEFEYEDGYSNDFKQLLKLLRKFIGESRFFK